jgi:prophage DNA circulation protein
MHLMTVQDQFTAFPKLAEDSWNRVAETWTGGFARSLEQLRLPAGPALFDPSTVVTQWFDAAQQVLEANRTYVKSLANVASNLDGALREQTASTVKAARSQFTGAVENVATQVEEFDRTAQEQTAVLEDVQEQARREAEAAERVAAREAQAAERAAAREARAEARERYEEMRKADLVEELGRRGLTKTGNVDELVERLVEDDTK